MIPQIDPRWGQPRAGLIEQQNLRLIEHAFGQLDAPRIPPLKRSTRSCARSLKFTAASAAMRVCRSCPCRCTDGPWCSRFSWRENVYPGWRLKDHADLLAHRRAVAHDVQIEPREHAAGLRRDQRGENPKERGSCRCRWGQESRRFLRRSPPGTLRTAPHARHTDGRDDRFEQSFRNGRPLNR